MTEFTPLAGLIGGIFIGLSAVVLMAGLGRIAGISGIVGALVGPWTGENNWRALFILGLIGGTVLAALAGAIDQDTISFPGNPVTTIAGGLLVGFGTSIGKGCTSGHGICGMARLSRRSMVATAVFMVTAMATVYLTRHVFGG